MKLTKIATVLLFLSPAYLSAATQDFTYRNGYKITADQVSPEVNIRIKDNKPTQSISAPNSNGISHNYFTEFNVGKNGLNIDNSPSARVIINEVTGTNISQLDGTMAIIGKQASLVIANPNGVNCNSCGVSNVSHLTLLAGNTSLDVTTGKLIGFKNITNNVIVSNVKKNAIKSNLTLTGNSVEINSSYVNSPHTTINIGADNIDLKNNLNSQISDVKLTPGKVVNSSGSYSNSLIDSDTKIRGKMTVNAKNATLTNNGNIILSEVNLNLLHSELINDGYLKASNININAKNGSISNYQKISTKNLTADYNGNFSIYNTTAGEKPNNFYAQNMSINSHNINHMIDLKNNAYQGYLRDNTLSVSNDTGATFATGQFNIAGKHDAVHIKNDGIMFTGKMNVTAGSVQFYNDHYLRTDADSAIHGIVGVYGNGSRNENVSVTTHNFDI
ncbi:filamentous hemagglutinin N-terminal domain-containing protein [Morganella morganii]|uniref:two-partner secretion domain-containing protein n=1 Tax=Morganella morganii TaxID=582 RepID=UPI001BD926D9|nr:filamentous hemagglutinin N-terminal domain-containing protein [Morganella morganii]MBT0403141.1 filamentous hemagglutinin N-terminal domain-containing protein [Morganella morganii subsp. morganii]